MNKKQLYVFYEQTLVGVLLQGKTGEFIFEYDTSWTESTAAFNISISLPRADSKPKSVNGREENDFSYASQFPTRYKGEKVKNYFSGLLPEGDVRDKVAARLEISPESDFKLLRALGLDCAGALRIVEDYEAVKNNIRRIISIDALSDALLNYRYTPFIVNNGSIRMSLAGAQYKLPIIYEKNDYYFPEGLPSTHIIKLPIQGTGICNSVENEALCLTLAKLIGIPTVSSNIVRIKEVSYLLIERYDRIQESDGSWKRLHQEDICQALSYSTERKYELSSNPNKRGPGIKDISELIRAHSAKPSQDLGNLIKQFVYNYYIKNRDAHGKNYSLLYTKNGIELAPLYDVLNTELYPYDKKMAMRLGKTYDAALVQERDWEIFADQIGVNNELVRTIRNEILEGMKSKIYKAIDVLFKKDIPEVVLKIKEDIENLPLIG